MPNLEEKPKIVWSRNGNKHPLIPWFEMTEDQVVDKFASLPNSKVVGKGDSRFVFVQGNEPNKPLLVAHADTVFGDEAQIKAAYANGVYFSMKQKQHIGIGADDRAGCAILWECRDFGCSMLVPLGEESGGTGSSFLNKTGDWSKKINEYQFMIEFDRMNDSDLAFYDVGSPEFKDWCEKIFPEYKRVGGSFTDICVLCKDICGTNISIGYHGQHGSSEILVEKQWLKTLELTKNMIQMKDIPRFIKPPKSKPIYNRWSEWDEYEEKGGYGGHSVKSQEVEVRDEEILRIFAERAEDIIVCPKCEHAMMELEYSYNENKCTYCGEKF